ncbi:hypothetical protein QFZ30_003057 [Arthrobacter pascens]|uniref:protein DpdG n=1 Tax=Arthrobacter pascens TaxID=1677 RepID=UPI002792A7F9|nr:protein DpdG [Arthrobacter pascens]MDQ0679675.1 hypothetical protein [Arthrobacter pascens]
MAVLNPPRVLPGLGRAIINFLIENRSNWDEAKLIDAFKPPGVNDDGGAESIKNTLSAFRAIGMLENNGQGNTTVTNRVTMRGSRFGRDEFRRLMLSHVLDLSRDGNPWAVGDEEASTSGARDLTRALSWFLAQDALGTALSWNDNVQKMQADQFGTTQNDQWPIANDTRWNAFSRWAPALGLAVPSIASGNSGLVPLPTLAIADAVAELPNGHMPIQDFLDSICRKLPVLPGGVIRNGLVARLNVDPDPGVQGDALDTSIAQVLRILEARGHLTLDNLADASGVFLSRSSHNRTTHVTLKGGKKR